MINFRRAFAYSSMIRGASWVGGSSLSGAVLRAEASCLTDRRRPKRTNELDQIRPLKLQVGPGVRRFGSKATFRGRHRLSALPIESGPSRLVSTRPSVMGPMMSSLPSERHAAELMLLSGRRLAATSAVRGSGEPIDTRGSSDDGHWACNGFTGSHRPGDGTSGTRLQFGALRS